MVDVSEIARFIADEAIILWVQCFGIVAVIIVISLNNFAAKHLAGSAKINS
jgi:hypothetical protein